VSGVSLLMSAQGVMHWDVFREWQCRREPLDSMGVQLLTALNTAAYLPLSAHSATVTALVDDFKWVIERFKRWKKGPHVMPAQDDIRCRRHRYKQFEFVQRLMFYEARLEGKSMQDFETEIARVREELSIHVD
jgi:hypothetical protein